MVGVDQLRPAFGIYRAYLYGVKKNKRMPKHIEVILSADQMMLRYKKGHWFARQDIKNEFHWQQGVWHELERCRLVAQTARVEAPDCVSLNLSGGEVLTIDNCNARALKTYFDLCTLPRKH